MDKKIEVPKKPLENAGSGRGVAYPRPIGRGQHIMTHSSRDTRPSAIPCEVALPD